MSRHNAQPVEDRPEAGHSGLTPVANQAAELFEGTAYRGVRSLGAGGMGEVYLVEHRVTGRELVAKVLRGSHAKEPQLLHRLRIEAQALGRLQHDNIVSVIGFGSTAGGRPFIVMEYLQGQSLGKLVRAGAPMSVDEALQLAEDLLSALAAAHEQGIVHRDIKPDNLFICERPDGTRQLKVFDFGIARVLPGASSVLPMPADLRTETGVVLGTPRYLSPEAAMGERVDTRADLYAAGLVLYVMLTGRDPFQHLRGDELLVIAHAVEIPAPPSRFAQEPIPFELDQAILRALAKDPATRFQTAEEFGSVVRQIREHQQRPSGWLRTSTFDARALRVTQPEPEPTVAQVPEQREATADLFEGPQLEPDALSEPAARNQTRERALFLLSLVLGFAVMLTFFVLVARWLT